MVENMHDEESPITWNADLWQEAQDRVLLYLKKLGMPAVLSLEIAHKALHTAMDEMSAGKRDLPVQSAMRALHGFLHDSGAGPLSKTACRDYPILFRRRQSPASTASDQAASASLPLHRGSMKIRKI